MRTYKVSGLADGQVVEAARRALGEHFGESITVDIDSQRGEVRIDRSADPQVVNFLLEGAGCSVIAVGG